MLQNVLLSPIITRGNNLNKRDELLYGTFCKDYIKPCNSLSSTRGACVESGKLDKVHVNKLAKVEQAEIERLATETAKQAKTERLERQRIERDRAVAAQRQKEEWSRMLNEANAEAKRAEIGRLVAEAAKQAELERLERKRIESD